MSRRRIRFPAGIATLEHSTFHLHKGNGMVRDVFHTRHMQRLAGKDVSSLSIEFAPLDPGTEYSVGVSNYSDGAWLFLSTASDQEFHFDLTGELARLINEAGNLYFVVVVNGGATATVHSASVESHMDDNPAEILERDFPGPTQVKLRTGQTL